MRKITTIPSDDDLRTRTFFAWFPVSVATKHVGIMPKEVETRWLEKVTVEERYFKLWSSQPGHWSIVRFVDPGVQVEPTTPCSKYERIPPPEKP